MEPEEEPEPASEQKSSEFSYLKRLPVEEAFRGRLADESEALSMPSLYVLTGKSSLVNTGVGRVGEIYSHAFKRTLGKMRLVSSNPPRVEWDEPVLVTPLAWTEAWEWLVDEGKVIEFRTTNKNHPRVREIPPEERWKKRVLLAIVVVEEITHLMTFRSRGVRAGSAFYQKCAERRPLPDNESVMVDVPLAAQEYEFTSFFSPDAQSFVPQFHFRRFLTLKEHREMKLRDTTPIGVIARRNDDFEDVKGHLLGDLEEPVPSDRRIEQREDDQELPF